jgi:hypothetical protein
MNQCKRETKIQFLFLMNERKKETKNNFLFLMNSLENKIIQSQYDLAFFSERKAAEAEKLEQMGIVKIEKELSKLMINSKPDSAMIKRKIVIATYSKRN